MGQQKPRQSWPQLYGSITFFFFPCLPLDASNKTREDSTADKNQIMGIKSKTFDISTGSAAGVTSKLSRLKLTDKERKKLQDMIKKANSLEEIIRLEKALQEGQLPPGIISEDAMQE